MELLVLSKLTQTYVSNLFRMTSFDLILQHNIDGLVQDCSISRA